MQPPREVASDAMPANGMRTANLLKSHAENLRMFSGHCLTKMSLMNRSPLFPTDVRDSLSSAFDARRNWLKLPMC